MSFLNEHVPQFIQRYKIFAHNPRLLIWLIISFITTYAAFYNVGIKINVFVLILIYFIFISIALSNLVEIILRFFEDVRHVATATEKERLLPLFEKVYTEASHKSGLISPSIKLYIVDDISINAFALGRNTIAVTRGLMENMDDDEIEGVLAHEFGHMAYGDPQISTLVALCTTYYLWGLLFFKGIFKLFENATKSDTRNTSSLSYICSAIAALIDLGIKILMFIWLAILASGGRKKEYRADSFAKGLGYGEALLSALYKLYDLQISDKRKLVDRIKKEHPRTAYRIEALENS